jgi:nitrite reductase (NADH) large subunit
MPRQLNRAAGDRLKSFVEEIGIKVRLNSRTDEIVGDERVAGVKLDSGDTVPADAVVITTGVRPNSCLARRAGLEVNRGLIVNNRLLTSHPDVFAAGDVAEHRGVLYGNWSASQFQGSIAGMNAVGGEAEFGGIPRSNMLKVLGLDMLSIGQFEPEDGSFQVIEGGNGSYSRFVFRDGCLVGSVLLGDTSFSGALKKALESREDFSGLLRKKPSADEIQAALR